MNSQKVRDRINELQLLREDLIWFKSAFISILFGLTAVYWKFIDSLRDNLRGSLITSLLFMGIIMLLFYIFKSYALKKDEKICSRIKNNYDLILGRKNVEEKEYIKQISSHIKF